MRGGSIISSITSSAAILFLICVAAHPVAGTETKAHEDCSKGGNITVCLSPVKEPMESLSFVFHEEKVGTKLEKICGAVNETKSCLIRHNCEEDKSRILFDTWRGMKDSYIYLCTEGKQAYMDSKNCWETAHISHGVPGCTGREKNGTADNAYKCKLDNERIACIKNLTMKHCGQKAADVITSFVVHRLKPVAKFSDCKLDEDTEGGASTIKSTLFFIMSAIVALIKNIECQNSI